MGISMVYIEKVICVNEYETLLEAYLNIETGALNMHAIGPKTLDPKEAIVYRLQFYASRGRPCVPDISTVQFLKARLLPEYQLHYITVQDMAGQRWHFTYFLSQRDDSSWFVQSGSGGREHERMASPAIDDRPCLHLQWGQTIRFGSGGSEFRAGGEVFDSNVAITRVHLISSNGVVLEDTVQDGLVLFWSDQEVALPVQAEMLNSSGEVVGHQTVLLPPHLPPDAGIQGFFHPVQ
jgi:hypothetical protein